MLENTSLMLIIMIASLLLNLITMIVVIMLFKKVKPSSRAKAASTSVGATHSVAGVVFCRQCGDSYDSTLLACPSCKAAR